MKKIFSCYFIFIQLVFAQGIIDSSKIYEKKLNFSDFFNPDYFLNNQFRTDISNFEFNYIFQDSNSILTNTRILLSSFNNEQFFFNSPNQVLNPLYESYLEKQKLQPLYKVLGTVQVGAVGYLAYKHLRKYGFLKKK
ncbi:MAG: hypothetical protein N2321_07835 [Melioribacteraceae bacterium]|nr:hypothetical protein [Melioribacteraceae bacterium]